MNNLKTFAQGLNVLYGMRAREKLKILLISVLILILMCFAGLTYVNLCLFLSDLLNLPLSIDNLNIIYIGLLSVFIVYFMITGIFVICNPKLTLEMWSSLIQDIKNWFDFICQQAINKDQK
jgi:uncharacterized membrane protein YbhN (UPF0104 family)